MSEEADKNLLVREKISEYRTRLDSGDPVRMHELQELAKLAAQTVGKKRMYGSFYDRPPKFHSDSKCEFTNDDRDRITMTRYWGYGHAYGWSREPYIWDPYESLTVLFDEAGQQVTSADFGIRRVPFLLASGMLNPDQISEALLRTFVDLISALSTRNQR